MKSKKKSERNVIKHLKDKLFQINCVLHVYKIQAFSVPKSEATYLKSALWAFEQFLH